MSVDIEAAEIGFPHGFKVQVDPSRGGGVRLRPEQSTTGWSTSGPRCHRPRGAADMRDAVAFARQRRLLLAVRCGGRGVAGVSPVEDRRARRPLEPQGRAGRPGAWHRDRTECRRPVGGVDRETEIGLATPGGR